MISDEYFRGLAIDEPWQRIDITPAGGNNTTTTNRIYLADALGSIIALSDTNKTIQTEYDYEPFGATTTTGAGNKNAYKFTAREDDGTGLYYYRARYYHPALGRFVSEDPLGFVNGANLYLYALASPLNWIDPAGLDVFFVRDPAAGGHSWLVIGFDPVPQGGPHSYGFWPGPEGRWWRRPGEVRSPDDYARNYKPGDEISFERWQTTTDIDRELEEWIRANFCINCTEENPNYNVLGYNCGDFNRQVRGRLRAILREHGVKRPTRSFGNLPPPPAALTPFDSITVP